MLEAKKDQSPNKLEREKPNMTHTKCNLNLQGDMKDRYDGKSNYKGGVGACNWQPKDEEQNHAQHAARDNQGQIPNADMKSIKKNLVSEDLKAGQSN